MPVLKPRVLLHVEGAAALALSLLLYQQVSGNWGLFLALVLVPDLSLLGYLLGRRVGAPTYNVMHTYTWPMLLAAVGVSGYSPWALPVALVWAFHISLDRMVGWGLNYLTGKDTHMQRVRDPVGERAAA